MKASWLLGSNGELVATADGTAFLKNAQFGNNVALFAVRLADGRPVWQMPVGLGWDPRLVADAIIVRTEAAVTAFDASDGSQRWRWQAPSECDQFDLSYGEADSLVAACAHTAYRIGARDGATSWRWSAQSNCLIRSVAANNSIVAMTVTCGMTKQDLYVLDVKSGTERWQRRVAWHPEAADPDDSGQGAAWVSVAGGAVTVGAYVRDGTETYTLSGAAVRLDDGPAIRDFIATVNSNLIYRQNTDFGTIIGAVDPDTGSVLWKRSISLRSFLSTNAPQPIGVVDDVLYVMGNFDLVWPATVVLIDARTGAMTLTATDSGSGELAGVDDTGTLYAQLGSYGHYRLVAVRVAGHSTGFLGGLVQANSWPDTCRLLSANQWRDAFPEQTPNLKPQYLEAGEVTLPTPPRCRYLPRAIDGTEVTVDVSWLTDSAEHARVAAARQDPFGREPSTETVGSGRYEAWRWDDTNTGVDLVPHIRVSFAVGICVANVATIGDGAPLNMLAGYVADNLADPSISPACTTSGGKETN